MLTRWAPLAGIVCNPRVFPAMDFVSRLFEIRSYTTFSNDDFLQLVAPALLLWKEARRSESLFYEIYDCFLCSYRRLALPPITAPITDPVTPRFPPDVSVVPRTSRVWHGPRGLRGAMERNYN